MRIRKYAGILIGLILSLSVAATAMAQQIGPNSIYNQGQGWNSETWSAGSSGTTWFEIRYCQSSVGSLKFDLMHHWPFFPSTGTAERTLTCSNDSTWRATTWSSSNATYSVEYTWNNGGATITLWYQIFYPG